jgi:hypothetical protein
VNLQSTYSITITLVVIILVHYLNVNLIYCDVFGRMPPLLCNRKLDTPVVAMQPKAKHLHGYAHATVGRSSVSIGAARYYKGKVIDNSELV